MSKEMINCAWKDTRLSDPEEKSVMVALAWRHSFRKGCFPKMKLLMEMTSLSESTIHRCLKRLEKKGIITIKHGGKGRGKGNSYILQYNVPIKPSKIVHAAFAT